METKDVLLLIGPLVGVILGGLITSTAKWIELLHTRSLELAKIRIAKLDDVHKSLLRYLNEIENLPVTCVRIATKGNYLDNNNRLQQALDIEDKIGSDAATIAAQIRLYSNLSPGDIVANALRLGDAAYDYVALPPAIDEVQKERLSLLQASSMQVYEALVLLALALEREAKTLLHIKDYPSFKKVPGDNGIRKNLRLPKSK